LVKSPLSQIYLDYVVQRTETIRNCGGIDVVLPHPVHKKLILVQTLTQSQKDRKEGQALRRAHQRHLLLPQPSSPVSHNEHLIRDTLEGGRNPVEVDCFCRALTFVVAPTFGTVIKLLHLNLNLHLTYYHGYHTTSSPSPSCFLTLFNSSFRHLEFPLSLPQGRNIDWIPSFFDLLGYIVTR
jgi:hypothetical protein